VAGFGTGGSTVGAVRPVELVRRVGLSTAESAALVVLAAGALVALALLYVLSRDTATVTSSAPLQVVGTPVGAPTPAPTELVVHVAGHVVHPGLVSLPAGARVADAIAAAGGPRRGAVLDGLNLARLVTDGEQLVVGDGKTPAAIASGPAPAAAGAPASPGAVVKVSLNQATVAQLDTLPGIGPVLAQRIVDHRDSIGGFTEVGQLRDVPGIGEKTFQALADLVTL
jgi:competence protein ComEA